MRSYDGMNENNSKDRAERRAVRAETLSEPSSFRSGPRRLGGPQRPFLNQAMPLLVAVAASVAVIVLFSQADRHPAAAEEVPNAQSAASALDVTDRFAVQQEEIERLASKLQSVTEKLDAMSATAEGVNPVRAKLGYGPATSLRSALELKNDLDNLRAYVKDVADSVAVIDAQVSDPAVLQRKLDHQRALSRQ
jgi:hypothetical protein